MDPEPVRRPREPRRDRLPAPHATRRSTAAIRTSRRSPRSPPRGRWCRAPPTSAASASASSGTWGGCTTPSTTCAAIRSTASTTTTSSPSGSSTRFTRTSCCRFRTTRSCTARGRCSTRCRGTSGRSFANLRLLLSYHVGAAGQEAPVHGRRDRAVARVAPRREPGLAPPGAPAARGGAPPRDRTQPRVPGGARAAPVRLQSGRVRVGGLRRLAGEHRVVPAQGRRRRRRSSWSATSRRSRGSATGSGCRPAAPGGRSSTATRPSTAAAGWATWARCAPRPCPPTAARFSLPLLLPPLAALFLKGE